MTMRDLIAQGKWEPRSIARETVGGTLVVIDARTRWRTFSIASGGRFGEMEHASLQQAWDRANRVARLDGGWL